MTRQSDLVKLLVLIVLGATLACSPGRWASVLHCLEAPFKEPPPGFASTDLVGTWAAHYTASGTDTLILRADGTFMQVYQEDAIDYRFHTAWNQWWLQTMGDGAVLLHLEGGRYYPDGIIIAELDGLGLPCPESEPDCWQGLDLPPYGFYDPVQNDVAFMVGELVLNVRSDSTGELLLLHMWPAPDESFGVLTCQSGEFRRVSGR